MAFFNQHSFTISALVVILVLGALLFRDGVQANDFIILGATILGFALALFFFRPGDSTLNHVEEVEDHIGKDLPVLLEFQSNY